MRQAQDRQYLPRHSQRGGSSGKGTGATKHNIDWVLGKRMQRCGLYTLGMYEPLSEYLRSHQKPRPKRRLVVKRIQQSFSARYAAEAN